MTMRRTTLQQVPQDPQQIELLTKSKGSLSEAKEIGLYAAAKVADSIPELIELTKMVVEVKKVEAQAEAIAYVLRERTKAFVDSECARRDTLKSRAEAVTELMRQLHASLLTPGITEEVQKLLIENCNLAVKVVLQQSEEA